MFNIGFGELIIVFLILLLLFGATRLPEVGIALGKAIKGFKKGVHEPDEDAQRKEHGPPPSS